MDKVCKIHTHWPKQGKKDQSRVNSIIGTQLSPIQHKNVTGHSVKHLVCNSNFQLWTMHEHEKKMPQYKHKLPQGANTRTNIANKTQPNQDFERNLHKNKKPQPIFEKSPI